MRGRTFGVVLACASFVGGAVSDMFKRKLLTMGMAPAEVILVWNSVDCAILLVGSITLDPFPPVLEPAAGFWRALLFSASLCVTGSVLHAGAIKKGGLASVPFLSFNPAWSLLISSVVNGEVPNAQGVGGVIVLTMGALVLSHANASQARPPVDAGLPPPADSSDGEHAMRGHASMLRGAAHDGVLADESTLLLADADGNAPRRPRPYSKPSGGHAHAAQPSARDARDASAMMALSGLCWASASSFEKLGLSAGRSWRAHHFLCLQKFVMAMPLLGHFLVQRFAGGSAKRARQPLPCSRRPVLALLLVSACLDTFSVLTYFMSLEWIFVSFSLALKRAGGILLAVLGGMLVFGEVVSRLAWGSIVVMVAGVILVVTS